MGVYWMIANHTKKQRLSLEKIGGGGNKVFHVVHGPAAKLMADLMVHEWIGDHVTVEPDYDSSRYFEVEREYEDVTDLCVTEHNETARLSGEPEIALHEFMPTAKKRPPPDADMTPTGPAQVITHADIQYAVVMTPFSHHVEFTAYAIEGFTDDVPTFWEKGATSNFPGTKDVASAERFCSGYVKWDGCANLSFEGNVHLCGYGMAGAVGTLLKRVYEKAKEMMPTADFSTDPADFVSGVLESTPG